MISASDDLLALAKGRKFRTILADPPWKFQNSTGKVAPEHRRLNRYGTMKLDAIKELPVSRVADETAHLYLWAPNALLQFTLTLPRQSGVHHASTRH